MDESDLPLIIPSAEKPRLSEVIDYEREIAPYSLTMIYAGLGSGKNTFAGYLMNGSPKYNLPKLTVLLITSRKAKVVETLSDEDLDISNGIGDKKTLKQILKGHPLGLDVYRRKIEDDPRGWGNIIQRSTACTNAFIEKYHQYVYDPNDPSTHLWNRFDVIIVDEVHALVTDSTFQFSPFHTLELAKQTVRRIREALANEKKPPEKRDPNIKKPVCQNVIFMTGTPEAVQFLEAIPEMNLLDKRAECRNIAPKNLHLIDKEQALKQIKDQLKVGERIIYFANHITLIDELAKLYELPREYIAMQFSDEKRLKEMERESDKQKRAALKAGVDCPETDFDKLNDIQNKLAVEEVIRKGIQLFVTTSKNKEGININNEDIHHVYIEEHSLTDIRQMAGRLRCGAEHAYVIVDSQGHNTYEHPQERWLTRQMCAFDLAWNDIDVLEANIRSQADAMLGYKCAQNVVHNLVRNPHSQKRAYSEEYPDVGRYRWTDDTGTRHSIYAPTLDELRAKEALIEQDNRDKIKPEARSVTLNDMYELWKQLKRGLKDNTFQNYVYMDTQYAAPRFGQKRISSLVKSDVKRFYNTLADERGLSIYCSIRYAGQGVLQHTAKAEECRGTFSLKETPLSVMEGGENLN